MIGALARRLFGSANDRYIKSLQPIVDEINGVKVKTLEDVADAFKKPDAFYVIRVVGDPQPLVMEAKAVAEARERILQRYRIPQEQYLKDSILPEKLTAKNTPGR